MQFAGRLNARMTRGGLELAETSYGHDQHVARHVHDRPLVVLLLAGQMLERAGGRRVRCSAGTVLFHPAGEAHAHDFGPHGSRCMVLQVGDQWVRRLSASTRMVPDRPMACSNEAVTGTARRLHAELRRGEGAMTAVLDGLSLALLGLLARPGELPANGASGLLAPVLEKLHHDPTSDVSLAALAALARVTPEHLSRAFCRTKGCTIGEYVRRLRVQRARRRLATGDVPLSQLAYDLGFCDQSHFTRVFKAHVGCTPAAFRAAACRGSKGCGNGSLPADDRSALRLM